MGEPNTAHRRVAALMGGWTGCDTRTLYAAAARVQSAKSGPPGGVGISIVAPRRDAPADCPSAIQPDTRLRYKYLPGFGGLWPLREDHAGGMGNRIAHEVAGRQSLRGREIFGAVSIRLPDAPGRPRRLGLFAGHTQGFGQDARNHRLEAGSTPVRAGVPGTRHHRNKVNQGPRCDLLSM
jgi:hypothetical protein